MCYFFCSYSFFNWANSASEIGGIGMSANSSLLRMLHVYMYTPRGNELTRKKPARFFQKNGFLTRYNAGVIWKVLGSRYRL